MYCRGSKTNVSLPSDHEIELIMVSELRKYQTHCKMNYVMSLMGLLTMSVKPAQWRTERTPVFSPTEH